MKKSFKPYKEVRLEVIIQHGVCLCREKLPAFIVVY